MIDFKKFPDIVYPVLSDDAYRENSISNIDIFCWKKEIKIDQKAPSNSIVFVMEGLVEVSYRHVSKQRARKGFFFLLPMDTDYTLRFRKRGRIIVFHIEENLLLKYISKNVNKIYRKESFNHENYDVLNIQTSKNISKLLKGYISETNIRFRKDYSMCKTEELLILLKSSYSEKLLAGLFQPVFNDRFIFKSIVLQNRNKLFTVEEFAAVTHLNRNTFRLRFKEVFGMRPLDWIHKERSASIFRELTETKKPVFSIMSEYGFESFPNFARFCRTHLKNSPGLIRKNNY